MLPLSADRADVWLAWPEEADASTLSACVALLSGAERGHHDQLRFAADRALYAAAHALVRRALSRYAAVAPAEWRFVVDEHGRPRVAAAAGLPPIAFNLSHTRGLCACVVGGAEAVGVDVEELRADADLGAVAARSFAPAERAALRALGDGAAALERFYALWTLKEAYLKARGLGLALPLDAVAFAVDDARVRVEFAPALADDAGRWWFALAAPSHRHRLALAVRKRRAVAPTARLYLDRLRDDAPTTELSLTVLASG